MIIRITKSERLIILFIAFAIGLIICRHKFSSEIGEAVLTLETVVFFLALMCTNWQGRIKSNGFFVYAFFIAYRICLSVFLGKEYDSEVKRILYRELGVFIVLYLVVGVTTLNKIILIIRDFGVITSILGIIEYFSHKSVFLSLIPNDSMIFMKYALGTANWRVRTCFMHPIVCAVFVTVAWTVFLYEPYSMRFMNYLASVTLFFCLLTTKSRSSWISFAIVMGAYIFKKLCLKNSYVDKNSIYWFVFVLVISGVFCVLFNDRIAVFIDAVISRWTSGMNYSNAGNYNRISMIRLGISDWKKSSLYHKIVGHGPEYAITLLRKHSIRGWDLAVDNSYITAVLNYGLIGVSTLLLLIGSSVWKFLTTRSRNVEMASLAVLSILVSGFFYDIYGWFTVIICLGVFLLAQYEQEV